MEERKEIFEGPIVRTLIKISLPIIAGMAADLFYTISNTFFLAFIDRNSTAIISGFGLAYPVYFIILAICQGFFGGMTTLTAVATGERKQEKIRKALNTGLILEIIIAAVFVSICNLWGSNIISALGGGNVSPEVLENGYEFLVWLAPGTFFLTISHIYMGLAQGIGDTRYVGIALIISTVFNTILSPLFIYVFHMGVRGAALGMSVAWVIMFLYLILATRRIIRRRLHKYKSVVFSASSAWELTRLGLPQTAGMMAIGITAMFLNRFVSMSGETALNAFVLVSRFDNFIFTPILALAFGMETMIGQNYGRRLFDRVLATYRKGTLITWLFVLVVALLYIIFARQLIGIFTNVRNVIDLSVMQIHYVTFFIATGATLGICSSSAFQSVMKPMYSLVLTIVRIVVFTLPLAWLLTALYAPSMKWIWISTSTGNILGGLFGFLWCAWYLSRMRKRMIVH